MIIDCVVTHRQFQELLLTVQLIIQFNVAHALIIAVQTDNRGFFFPEEMMGKQHQRVNWP